MKFIVYTVIGVLLFGTATYLMWQFKRNWNYSWAYESRVQETVCEMVKPEYLIDPEDCE